MRGKKYKAKDKKVQKSGRGGLLEINLHSHESVNISSREKEDAFRKVPGPGNYRETRRRGSSTGAGKKKQRRQLFQASGTDSQGCKMELDSGYQEPVPGEAGKRAQAAGTADACGMERRQPRDAVRQELKYDTVHPSLGCNASDSREDEKAPCGQEHVPYSGMDAEDADRRLFHERGHISVQPCRGGSMQQPYLRPAGMESIRKYPHRKREKRQRKSRSYQKGRQNSFPGENGAGVYGKESVKGGVSSASPDMGGCGGMPEGRGTGSGSSSADESWKTDSTGKTFQEKKQRLFFSRDEKTGTQAAGKEVLKGAGGRNSGQEAGAGNGGAGSRNAQEAAGKEVFKDNASRKGTDTEKKILPDSPENSSRKKAERKIKTGLFLEKKTEAWFAEPEWALQSIQPGLCYMQQMNPGV